MWGGLDCECESVWVRCEPKGPQSCSSKAEPEVGPYRRPTLTAPDQGVGGGYFGRGKFRGGDSLFSGLGLKPPPPPPPPPRTGLRIPGHFLPRGSVDSFLPRGGAGARVLHVRSGLYAGA